MVGSQKIVKVEIFVTAVVLLTTSFSISFCDLLSDETEWTNILQPCTQYKSFSPHCAFWGVNIVIGCSLQNKENDGKIFQSSQIFWIEKTKAFVKVMKPDFRWNRVVTVWGNLYVYVFSEGTRQFITKTLQSRSNFCSLIWGICSKFYPCEKRRNNFFRIWYRLCWLALQNWVPKSRRWTLWNEKISCQYHPFRKGFHFTFWNCHCSTMII